MVARPACVLQRVGVMEGARVGSAFARTHLHLHTSTPWSSHRPPHHCRPRRLKDIPTASSLARQSALLPPAVRTVQYRLSAVSRTASADPVAQHPGNPAQNVRRQRPTGRDRQKQAPRDNQRTATRVEHHPGVASKLLRNSSWRSRSIHRWLDYTSSLLFLSGLFFSGVIWILKINSFYVFILLLIHLKTQVNLSLHPVASRSLISSALCISKPRHKDLRSTQNAPPSTLYDSSASWPVTKHA